LVISFFFVHLLLGQRLLRLAGQNDVPPLKQSEFKPWLHP
jgi:hypothetical protein